LFLIMRRDATDVAKSVRNQRKLIATVAVVLDVFRPAPIVRSASIGMIARIVTKRPTID
jgi:hypothetical protein